ncbi:MAG: MerR family transcriptional regulator [Desulfovibrio sp.]
MNWLSVAEIAKITRIPAPTARRYASLFREFLPSRKVGRVTKYSDDAVRIFEAISNLYQEGHVTGEIEDALKQEYSRTAEMAPEAADVPALGIGAEFANSFKEVMDKFGHCLQIIADQKIMIERQREDIQKLKTAFVLLSRSQKRLRHLPAAASASPVDNTALEERTALLAKKDSELEEMALNLSFDTSDIKAKLQILESELIRLRKDRREMEKFFQSKIDRIREED